MSTRDMRGREAAMEVPELRRRILIVEDETVFAKAVQKRL